MGERLKCDQVVVGSKPSTPESFFFCLFFAVFFCFCFGSTMLLSTNNNCRPYDLFPCVLADVSFDVQRRLPESCVFARFSKSAHSRSLFHPSSHHRHDDTHNAHRPARAQSCSPCVCAEPQSGQRQRHGKEEVHTNRIPAGRRLRTPHLIHPHQEQSGEHT
jgi:hypothetical protein